jgi:molybdopterin-binding protein
MDTSARNQIDATVRSVTLGAVMAEVVMDVGGVEIVAAITKDSAERLGLAAGESVVAVIKATDVMVGRREG